MKNLLFILAIVLSVATQAQHLPTPITQADTIRSSNWLPIPPVQLPLVNDLMWEGPTPLASHDCRLSGCKLFEDCKPGEWGILIGRLYNDMEWHTIKPAKIDYPHNCKFIYSSWKRKKDTESYAQYRICRKGKEKQERGVKIISTNSTF